ncbi:MULTISPECIES: hypothetical protein [unclassified Phyllobacterium]|uniref:hypothetical protein n=1 Tax=unclassified Phyllobacterium TaxID=2638441 RepID=UPI0030130E39
MDDFTIRSEMHEFVADKLENGTVVEVENLVIEMMNDRDSLEGDDAAFYRVHTFNDLKRIARSVIGKYDPKGKTDADVLLPGFKHLAKAYPMMRDGKSVLVPVDQCSDFELFSRASQLEDMAKGCRSHAGEIREYISARNEKAA